MHEEHKMIRNVAGGLAALAVGGALGWAASHSIETARAQDAGSQLQLGEQFTVQFDRRIGKKQAAKAAPVLGDIETNSLLPSTVALGKYFFDGPTSSRVVIRPETVYEWFQVRKGLNPAAARRAGDRLMDRIERTGRLKKLEKIERDAQLLNLPLRIDLDHEPYILPSSASAEEQRSERYERNAGPHRHWLRMLSGDGQGFELLRGAERFISAAKIDPGFLTSASLFSTRPHRRVLMNRRSRRHLVVLPTLPVRRDLSDAGLPLDGDVRLIARSGSGLRKSIVPRWADKLFLSGGETSFHVRSDWPLGGNDTQPGPRDRGIAPRMQEVTPPFGETAVSPDIDWEAPVDLSRSVSPDARPFVIRMQYRQPLDPRRVGPDTFTLTLRKARLSDDVPSPQVLAIPVHVELEQSHLGKVEVRMVPLARLDHDAEYEVSSRGTIRSLAGEFQGLDLRSPFATTPVGATPTSIVQDWDPSMVFVDDSIVLAIVTDGFVSATLLPDGAGVQAAPAPRSRLAMKPIEADRFAPLLAQLTDDPSTPEREDTIIHNAEGARVTILVRATNAELGDGTLRPGDALTPNEFLWTNWVPLADVGTISNRRFVQFGIEFELDADRPVDAPLPWVERIALSVR